MNDVLQCKILLLVLVICFAALAVVFWEVHVAQFRHLDQNLNEIQRAAALSAENRQCIDGNAERLGRIEQQLQQTRGAKP